jgi:hypothetical protein
MNANKSLNRSMPAPFVLRISVRSKLVNIWHQLARQLSSERVYGDPLHEAWDADGEPLPRQPVRKPAPDPWRYHIVARSFFGR